MRTELTAKEREQIEAAAEHDAADQYGRDAYWQGGVPAPMTEREARGLVQDRIGPGLNSFASLLEMTEADLQGMRQVVESTYLTSYVRYYNDEVDYNRAYEPEELE